MPHYTRAFAVELSAAEGKRITYGADCGPNEALVQFAADTDLLLIEATLPGPRDGARGHLTPGRPASTAAGPVRAAWC